VRIVGEAVGVEAYRRGSDPAIEAVAAAPRPAT
jgi:hypothetical protein